jgi:hypothetical protein
MEQLSQSEQLRAPGISIIVCCHNSSARLPETLRHLAAQVVVAIACKTSL